VDYLEGSARTWVNHLGSPRGRALTADAGVSFPMDSHASGFVMEGQPGLVTGFISRFGRNREASGPIHMRLVGASAAVCHV
jgi:hypothetical protein